MSLHEAHAFAAVLDARYRGQSLRQCMLAYNTNCIQDVTLMLRGAKQLPWIMGTYMRQTHQ